jgi:hypothetical protein
VIQRRDFSIWSPYALQNTIPSPVDESAERVKAAYGADRFARLEAVKRRLDPDNLFRFNHNIRPD